MKRFIAVLVVAVTVTASIFASVDMSLALGAQATYGSIAITTSDKDTKTETDFCIDAELDMDFGRGHGMMVGFAPKFGQSTEIGVSVGYAYQMSISQSCDMILAVGPTLLIKQSDFGLKFFATVDFDFDITQSFFMRVGTGLIVDPGILGDAYGDTVTFTIPLPSVALGWNF